MHNFLSSKDIIRSTTPIGTDLESSAKEALTTYSPRSSKDSTTKYSKG